MTVERPPKRTTTVLVTGASGYIGSHTCLELLNAGYQVIGIDNFQNSSPLVLAAIRRISGHNMTFFEGDVADPTVLARAFGRGEVTACIHFAGLKAVGESVAQPLKYYRTNISSAIALLEAMNRHRVRRLVFSSSCAVYGQPEALPITEASPLRPENPYGRTKLLIEDMLRDLSASDPSWRISLLRYFNPAGAHPTGELGEDPAGVPINLMPNIMQVAVGRREFVPIHGADYPTRDGSCVRDFVHVVDLALGHLAALASLDRLGTGCRAYNLGTGTATTVFEMLAASERAARCRIPRRVGQRRPGDAAEVYADPSLARRELGWVPDRDINTMCADHWRWQSNYPFGFRVPEDAKEPWQPDA
jgi:UDP-glucose 4-epimerase